MLGFLRQILGIETRAPATHDYGPGRRGWGHDYAFTPQDGGIRASMSGWGHGISEGDYLLLESSKAADGRARYRVDRIEYCRDPQDMWFAEVSFAPRPYPTGARS